MIGSLVTSPQLPSLTLILTTTERGTGRSLSERQWRRILVEDEVFKGEVKSALR